MRYLWLIASKHLSNGGAIGSIIVGRRRHSRHRIGVVRPRSGCKPKHIAKARMSVVMGEVSLDVTKNDAPPAPPPMQVEPYNHIGMSQQIIHPPQKSAFYNPGRLLADLLNVGLALFEGAFRARTVFIANHIQFVTWSIQTFGKLASQSGLAAACHADNVDASNR